MVCNCAACKRERGIEVTRRKSPSNKGQKRKRRSRQEIEEEEKEEKEQRIKDQMIRQNLDNMMRRGAIINRIPQNNYNMPLLNPYPFNPHSQNLIYPPNMIPNNIIVHQLPPNMIHPPNMHHPFHFQPHPINTLPPLPSQNPLLFSPHPPNIFHSPLLIKNEEIREEPREQKDEASPEFHKDQINEDGIHSNQDEEEETEETEEETLEDDNEEKLNITFLLN